MKKLMSLLLLFISLGIGFTVQATRSGYSEVSVREFKQQIMLLETVNIQNRWSYFRARQSVRLVKLEDGTELGSMMINYFFETEERPDDVAFQTSHVYNPDLPVYYLSQIKSFYHSNNGGNGSDGGGNRETPLSPKEYNENN